MGRVKSSILMLKVYVKRRLNVGAADEGISCFGSCGCLLYLFGLTAMVREWVHWYLG